MTVHIANQLLTDMKTGILQVQSFYADQMEAHGHGRKTFQIETDGQGTPIVHRVDGDHSDSHYKRTEVPGDEIRRAFDTSSIVQLVVMDISRSSGGNGTGIKQRGRAVIFGNWDWQTAAHELGHAFGLQHDFHDDAYIMSYGDQNSLSVGAAHFLAVNPYFNSRVPLQAGSAPSVELLSPTNYPYGVIGFVVGQPVPPLHVPVTLRVRDPDGVQQVNLFVKTPDRQQPNRPSGFLEVIEYRNLSGQTDTTITFRYEGNTPSFGDTDLINTLKHTIYVSAVDRQGNRIDHPPSWTLQATNVPKPEVPLSERSPRVAESIYNVVRMFDDQDVSSYDHITAVHLANITDLFVNHIRASDSPLQANDFTGLTNLGRLELRFESGYSESTLLPAGIFKGLTSLWTVRTRYYESAYYGEDSALYPILPFPVGLQKVGEGQFKAVVHTGAPSNMDVPIIVVNGSINGGATSVTIPAGSVESDVLTVTRTPGTTAAVVVDLERTPPSPSVAPGFLAYKSSYHLEMFSPLPGAPAPVAERTPKVLEAIVGKVPEINHIHHNRDLRYMINGKFVDKKYNMGHYVSEAHLAAITSLYVSGGDTVFESLFGNLSSGNWFSLAPDITTLKPGDFDGLTNLESLRLGATELRSLSASTFDKLTTLTLLNLSGNKFSSLPAGIFDKLTNLKTLSLNRNELGTLPTGIFNKLTNLKTLNLSSNQFSSLPAGLFDQLTNLTYLNLLENPLRSIPDGYFDNLTNLETLFLPPIITPPSLPGVNTVTPVANRTPEVRDAIVAAVPGVNSAADVTAAHLAAIAELDLSESEITALKSGDFDNLTGLEGLGIAGTFRTLPDGIFDHLVNLRGLVITGDRLSALPDGIFDETTLLSTLYIVGSNSVDESGELLDSSLLPGNQMPLRALPDGIFDNCTNLSYLAIIGTELSSLPDGIFDNFTNVPVILLSNNQLRSLPNGIFDKATMILDLSNNQLRSLPNGIFRGIFDEPPDLTGMSLLGIPLGQVPEGGFDNIDYTTVNLTGNLVDPLPLTVSLERVGIGQFKAVASAGAPFDIVLPIRIWYGGITGSATTLTIPTGSVESGTLTVTHNSSAKYAVTVDIQTLPELPNGHSGYTLVRSSDLPPTFTELGGRAFVPVSYRTPQVRDAILRRLWGARAQVHYANFVTEAYLTRIGYFSLSEESITSLKSGDFDGLTALDWLDLGGNQLGSLPAGIFDGLTALERIDLGGNQLSALPTGIFDKNTALEHIDLGGNQLSALPTGIFDKNTALEILSLHNNELSALPTGIFDKNTALEILSLSNNQLSSLPAGIFDKNIALERIFLNNNELSSLPTGIFDKNTVLGTLLLNNNQLSSVPAGFFGTALEEFYLSDNKVDPLPLTVSLEKVAEGQFKAVAPAGAPFDMVLPITVSNGSISGGATSITILKGKVESNTLIVTRTAGTTAAVTVNIGTLPSLPSGHEGYALVKSSDLPLTVINASGVVTNNAPVFTDGTSTTRTIAENTAANTNIGTAIAATDADSGDTLTYTLSGTDAAAFSIVSTSGQLQTRAALDYETKTSYSVTVSVSDGNGASDSITVTINVTDVNETPANNAPVFTDGTTVTRSVAENTASGQHIGAAVAATDADNDMLTYTLSGTDAAAFGIDRTTGQLKTNAALDYETQNTYTVTVTVSDGSLTDTIDVTINITDINELPTPTAICKVGDVLAPGESCTYPGTDAVFSVLDNGSSQWNIPDFPWLSKVSTGGSINFTADINNENYHFVAKEVSNNSWEIEAIGGDTKQQPDTPEQPGDTGGTPTLSVSTAAPLTEATLHGGVITLNLSSGTFESSSFTVRNAVSVAGITGIAFDTFDTERISDTKVTIKLEFDGNINTDSAVTITLGAGAIADYNGAALIAQIPVTAVSESVTASTAAPLTEATLDASVVILTLTGRKFERSNSTIRGAVSVSGIAGVTVQSFDIDRQSDTEVTVELTFNGNLNADGTLTFTVGPDAIAGYNGPALTDQVSVSDSTEPRILTEKLIESDYDHIEGPWLWMIAPGGDIDMDNLSEASEGVITEPQIAQNGVNEGDHFNELQWTSGRLLPTKVCGIFLCSSDNVINVVREIRLTDSHQLDQYSAYALINISSPRDQNDVLMGVGSDDSIKVWLNGSAVYKNDVSRRTTGIQNHFPVHLNAGNNLLLIKVCNHAGLGNNDWGMFFKLYLDTQDYTLSLPMVDSNHQQTVTPEVTETPEQPQQPSITGKITKCSGVRNVDGSIDVTVEGIVQANKAVKDLQVTAEIGGKELGVSLLEDFAAGESKSFTITGSIITAENNLQCGVELEWMAETGRPSPPVVLQPNLEEEKQPGVDDSLPKGLTASTTVPLTEATLHGGIVTLTLNGGTFESSHFRIRNAISVSGITGVTVESFGGERISDTQATIELEYDGNMTANGTLTVSLEAEAIQDYNGAALTAQIPVTAVSESVTASTAAPLTEATLNESVVTLTLTGRKFEGRNSTIRRAVSVSGISGVTVRNSDIDRQSDTEVTVELTFNGNLNADGTLTFTVGPDAIAGYNGPALTDQVSVSASGAPADAGGQNPDPAETPQQPGNRDTPEQPADTGGTPTLSVSTAAPLTEAMLHGEGITLTLSNGTFERSMFWIRNAISVSGITGVDVEPFGGKRISDTQAAIELEYEGNMTVNGTLTITLEADGIKDYDGATLTAQIQVTANTESVAASTTAPLTEATLDGSTVTLTLSGAKFSSSIWDIRGNVTVSGIAGVTIPWNQPKRKSDTELTVKLEFDGDMTTDGTLTFTVGADTISGYNGPALTAHVPVTADRENALLANFPNPFNPETWIPYQLEKPTEVTITIYAIDGRLVRTLALGHQPAGIYRSRSRAAYWDGKNAFGEPVASGVYFYTITAVDFTATRKMLIRK